MGQKTHPLGFRLGITQEHTTWYANFNQYANVLQEMIRTYINTIIKDEQYFKINRNVKRPNSIKIV
jgi:small subunit ribosomal protein S3